MANRLLPHIPKNMMDQGSIYFKQALTTLAIREIKPSDYRNLELAIEELERTLNMLPYPITLETACNETQLAYSTLILSLKCQCEALRLRAEQHRDRKSVV